MRSQPFRSLTCLIVSGVACMAAADAHAQVAMHAYYGTTHAHTGSQNNHGTDDAGPAEIFETARANGYDFLFLTEHSGPSGPTDPAGYFKGALATARLYSEDGAFAAFAGYEFSENGGDGDSDHGHLTGFGTSTFVSAAEPGMGFGTFLELMATTLQPWPGMIGYNHPPAGGHPASAVGLLTPERRDAVVMTEVMNGVTPSISANKTYFRAMINQLDRGWRIAPTCGQDGHGLYRLKLVETPAKPTCRTAVLAPRLTRWNVLNALENRRMFATWGTNLDVRYKVNGKWMGAEIGTPDTANFEIVVNDPDSTRPSDRITRIEVVGQGGVVLASQTFDAHQATWSTVVPRNGHAYMLVRVFTAAYPEPSATQDKGYNFAAVAAPVWFNAPRPLRPGFYYYN